MVLFSPLYLLFFLVLHNFYPLSLLYMQKEHWFMCSKYHIKEHM